MGRNWKELSILNRRGYKVDCFQNTGGITVYFVFWLFAFTSYLSIWVPLSEELTHSVFISSLTHSFIPSSSHSTKTSYSVKTDKRAKPWRPACYFLTVGPWTSLKSSKTTLLKWNNTDTDILGLVCGLTEMIHVNKYIRYSMKGHHCWLLIKINPK